METETKNEAAGKEVKRKNWLLLGAGFLAGCVFAYGWPHEPALASVADRDEQFSMMTCPVTLGNPLEAVFITDFTTGSIKGSVLNRQAGKFNVFYFANLAEDFQVDPSGQAHYAVVNGQANLSGGPGQTLASNVIYVAEQSSGKLLAYGFEYQDVPAIIERPQRLIPLDSFQWRKPR